MRVKRTRDFGDRLRDARGQVPLEKFTHRLRNELGDLTPSMSTLSRYESGVIREDKANPIVVWAISEVTGIPIPELSPHAEEVRKETARLLVKIGSRCKAGVAA